MGRTKAHYHHSGQGKPEPMKLTSWAIAWTSWGKEGLSGVTEGNKCKMELLVGRGGACLKMECGKESGVKHDEKVFPNTYDLI